MAEQVEPYVFPYSDVARFGIACAERLRDLLLNGEPSYNQPGLATDAEDIPGAPQFINRQGGGGGRDETTTVKAEVVFAEDKSGLPHVRIVGIQPRGGREEWGDTQWLVPVVISLDCYANQFNPGANTLGIDANNADAILGGFVWDLVNRSEVMTLNGFTFPQIDPNAPPGATRRDGSPFEYYFPITINCEVYMNRS